jgi:hypothetical protein
MYSASIPVFKQMLGGLSSILARAESHAATRKIEASALLHARLFPDMFHLIRQVQVACDFAKSISARLADVPMPVHEDSETSFSDLQERITKTMQFLDSLTAAQIDGSDTRQIVTQAGTPREKTFDGLSYLLHYGLPHFFFHVAAAYSILRHNGVEIGKKEYMGSY